MKLIVLFAFLLLAVFTSHAQRIDTLIDVGGYNLHFNITKGNGTPILFESGLGDDATIWDTILAPLHTATGATLITYDRPGYGKSGLSAALNDTSHGLLNNTKALETALKSLAMAEI
jgi:pimeloyl-ACP methyl ester carboxylesterase